MFCFSMLHIIMTHTLIFEIFRIGVVTGYRGGMLNLYSVYSNVRRLCALLCPAISFLHFHVLQCYVLHFHALHFHVRHFHVLQFHVMQVGPSFSRPAFSAPPTGHVSDFIFFRMLCIALDRQYTYLVIAIV